MCHSRSHLFPDVSLEPLHPVQSHDEPELERPEPPAQRDVPVPVVWDLSLVFVLQVQRINVEGVHYLSTSLRTCNSTISITKTRYLESFTHMVEQSKLTSIHLWGLKLKLSASSTPFSRGRNSGQMKELPA